mgnify:CR=1 FL=1
MDVETVVGESEAHFCDGEPHEPALSRFLSGGEQMLPAVGVVCGNHQERNYHPELHQQDQAVARFPELPRFVYLD